MFDNSFAIQLQLDPYNNTIQDCLMYNNNNGMDFSTAGPDNTVINCDILNNPWRGIMISYTDHLDFIDCEVGYDGGAINNGIEISDSTYVNISGGSVHNSGNDGIYVIQSPNCQVWDCEVYNNDVGIYFYQNG